MAIVACRNCGKDFYIKPSRLKIGKGKFCSKPCQYEYRGGELTRQYPKEYKAFNCAKERCRGREPKWKEAYTDRGIEFRFENFRQFFEHIGPKPTPAHTLDREDNDGHYEPGNVRWATWSEQALNRRPQRRAS